MTDRQVDGTGGASRRRRTRPKRKSEIVAAAAEIFYVKGYEATSMQDVADVVGILKGSLYHYINTKEDLLFEVIQQFHQEALQNLSRWKASEAGALTKLRVFVEDQVAHNARSLFMAATFYREFRSLNDERHDLIVAERDIYDNFVRDLIAEGQREGKICSDVDPKVSAIAILGMINSLHQWYRPDGPLAIEEIARTYGDLVMAALACDPATHVPGHRSDMAKRPG